MTLAVLLLGWAYWKEIIGVFNVHTARRNKKQAHTPNICE